jgi:hypothetical protein
MIKGSKSGLTISISQQLDTMSWDYCWLSNYTTLSRAPSYPKCIVSGFEQLRGRKYHEDNEESVARLEGIRDSERK